jgi:glucose-1-phosphate cytidylyltransferase
MRMRDYSENIPKALVQVGPYPVILHVMKIYAKAGVRKFILSLGYKSEMIREFFEKNPQQGMDVTCVDTGLETQTGGRVKLVEKHISSDDFFVTYCDGLSDIIIADLYAYHKEHGKIGTMAAVHPMSPFGMVEISGSGLVESFREKPFLKDYINGGFFVFRKSFLDYVSPEDVLEEAPMRKLVHEKQLAAYRHEGFWTCMDTFKDVDRLNSLWYKGEMLHTGYKGKVPWL